LTPALATFRNVLIRFDLDIVIARDEYFFARDEYFFARDEYFFDEYFFLPVTNIFWSVMNIGIKKFLSVTNICPETFRPKRRFHQIGT
jgi:hypothetical protein